jgi:hypothetical protein
MQRTRSLRRKIKSIFTDDAIAKMRRQPKGTAPEKTGQKNLTFFPQVA